jgi:hypothetical protein
MIRNFILFNYLLVSSSHMNISILVEEESIFQIEKEISYRPGCSSNIKISIIVFLSGFIASLITLFVSEIF